MGDLISFLRLVLQLFRMSRFFLPDRFATFPVSIGSTCLPLFPLPFVRNDMCLLAVFNWRNSKVCVGGWGGGAGGNRRGSS